MDYGIDKLENARPTCSKPSNNMFSIRSDLVQFAHPYFSITSQYFSCVFALFQAITLRFPLI